MEWEKHYRLSKSLVIHVSSTGKLVTGNSVSRAPQELSPHVLFVLACFAEETTPRAALQGLRSEEWDVEESEFEAIVARMIDQNMLTPVDEHEISPAQSGFASPLVHHGMLSDTLRVMTYKAAIGNHARGKRVVEVGCGTGILSIFAAKAGAHGVVAIEESTIAETARQMFAANGCEDTVELVVANSRDVHLDEPADLIIHEIIGNDPFFENVLPYIDDARERLLVEGGRLIPYRMEVCCLGFEIENKTRAMLEAGEFANLYGLNFDPILDKLRTADREVFTAMENYHKWQFDHKVLTAEARVYDIDFRQPMNSVQPACTFDLEVTQDGYLGGLVIYFRAHLDETNQLTNSPFSQSTSWGRDIRLLSKIFPMTVGSRLRLEARLDLVNGRHKLRIDLPKDGGGAGATA